MLPVERVVGDEGICATPGGLRLAMRLPWYRSLPFSTVEVGSLEIDGQPVDLGGAIVEYDGKSWPLSANGAQIDEFWFVRDSAFLLPPSQKAEAGTSHEVALNLFVSPPYIPGMKRANPQTETLIAA
ncbi:MAG: DUF6379 domain-containing protein [Novosphingobium sp.]